MQQDKIDTNAEKIKLFKFTRKKQSILSLEKIDKDKAGS
jgi:hypothetical protein